jgi:hypothetical protein
MQITDSTQNWTYTKTIKTRNGTSALDSAECIVERPPALGFLYALPNFGTFQFSSCRASGKSVTKAGVPSVQQLQIVQTGDPSRKNYPLTSLSTPCLNSDGSFGFSVTWLETGKSYLATPGIVDMGTKLENLTIKRC